MLILRLRKNDDIKKKLSFKEYLINEVILGMYLLLWLSLAFSFEFFWKSNISNTFINYLIEFIFLLTLPDLKVFRSYKKWKEGFNVRDEFVEKNTLK